MAVKKMDVPKSKRDEIFQVLSQNLVDSIDLTLQVKHAHWNVKGSGFHSAHLLFDEIYEKLSDASDEIAERLVALGGQTAALVKDVAKNSQLATYSTSTNDVKDHFESVGEALATYGKILRKDIKITDELEDAGTADLFTGISRMVDKYRWMVEAHLQGGR